jgi:hypothetical protein
MAVAVAVDLFPEEQPFPEDSLAVAVALQLVMVAEVAEAQEAKEPQEPQEQVAELDSQVQLLEP